MHRSQYSDAFYEAQSIVEHLAVLRSEAEAMKLSRRVHIENKAEAAFCALAAAMGYTITRETEAA